MKIKEINIQNYRKIHNSTINMESNITVIAGANNSGKTSLIELFNAVFGNKKNRLCGDDLPAPICQKWSNSAYSIFYNAYNLKKTKEETLTNICEHILSPHNPESAILIPPLTLKIQVDYNAENDDIRCFSDYIMEFDPNNTSFYFIYKYELNPILFQKELDLSYEKLFSRFKKLTGDEDKDKKVIHVIKEMLINLYSIACEETAYFSDRSYTNVVQMETMAFKQLFNYRHIMAGRTLDDENSDRTRLLSKNIIDIASQEADWKSLIRNLPDQIIQPIQDAQIQDKVRKASIATLSKTISEISKTNGGQSGNIIIDMDVTEDSINSLLKAITCAKYQTDDYYLNESSQGLGYSNLIYIHLQLEKFKKTIDPLIVNFFVIEEPEAHMHPQMQSVFTQYLFDYYKKEQYIQGVLTTHSHEVVRISKISQLRVLRQTSPFICQIFDLREFRKTLETDKDLIDFYDWFYTINFPDIIFADKIIMYEGDTERMLIKSVLGSSDYELLRNQYLSFVQVGGAYAYNYRPIIDFLGIKSVLITDLDYNKEAFTETDILNSSSTNETIIKFAKDALKKSELTIQDLYNWKETSSPIVIENICIAFQGKNDGLSRTLEEAMLSKYYGISALDSKLKADWKLLKESDKLKYTIPRDGKAHCIREIISHTSDNKTDFMYSVILNNLSNSMLPDYIKEALQWLAK